jgi:uncharacterized membrane protein YczE
MDVVPEDGVGDAPPPSRRDTLGPVFRRLVQLVGSCVVLGIGVGMLLRAALGSDGYSTMINGISLATEIDFALVNIAVAVILVAMAWIRGLVPGIGTVVQTVVVGVTVSWTLKLIDEPSGTVPRIGLLAAAFVLVSAGVAGYLGSRTGAGPTEGAALAFDPPVPFRWGYSFVQGSGALIGWLLGADLGLGTIVVVVGIGPVVDRLLKGVPGLDHDRVVTR